MYPAVAARRLLHLTSLARNGHMAFQFSCKIESTSCTQSLRPLSRIAGSTWGRSIQSRQVEQTRSCCRTDHGSITLRHQIQRLVIFFLSAQGSEEHTSELQSLRHLVC